MRHPFCSLAFRLFAIIISVNLMIGCGQKNDEIEINDDYFMRKILHLRINFEQSPVDGVPRGTEDVFADGIRYYIDIGVTLTPTAPSEGHFRGRFKIYKELPEGVMVLLFGECFYDAKLKELKISPFDGYVRCPNSVYENEGSVGNRTERANSPPNMMDISGIGPFTFKNLVDSKESDALVSHSGMNDGGYGRVILVPEKDSNELREWHFQVSFSTFCFMGEIFDSNWKGLNIGRSNHGMQQFIIDRSRSPSLSSINENN